MVIGKGSVAASWEERGFTVNEIQSKETKEQRGQQRGHRGRERSDLRIAQIWMVGRHATHLPDLEIAVM